MPFDENKYSYDMHEKDLININIHLNKTAT